jgi:sugar phosphate isomerase/epimerase
MYFNRRVFQVTQSVTRRGLLLAAGPAAFMLGTTARAADDRPPSSPALKFGLNTATVRGQKLPISETVKLAAEAGYEAIEPWINELEDHEKAGKSLKDLGKQIADLGLIVPSAIGFAEWGVEDESRRKAGLERARRDMDLVKAIGGTRIAAPPAGLTDTTGVDLLKLAERYHALLEIGSRTGIVPQLEVWGFSRTLSRLGEVALVAIESGHADACILADVFHLHKGRSAPGGLRMLNGAKLHVFHMNDYPSSPGPTEIDDSFRVYPTDGSAPLKEILTDLRDVGFHGVLSLELFNKELWEKDPKIVLRDGLAKMKEAVEMSQA